MFVFVFDFVFPIGFSLKFHASQRVTLAITKWRDIRLSKVPTE